ncbi:hypothetical protein JCM3774_002825 [Rhodotorula dairenensis]
MLAAPAETRDPNFPPNLAIAPSHARQDANNKRDDDDDDARQDIAGFGIAGRTWEAAYLLRDYLVPAAPGTANSPNPTQFDPPCPLFDPSDRTEPATAGRPSVKPAQRQTVIELGSGTGFLSLAIAPALRRQHKRKGTTLIMTDLENVCPLLEDNLSRAEQRWSRRAERDLAELGPAEQSLPTSVEPHALDVLVRPLPWGDQPSLHRLVRGEQFSPDIILASDLIYFEFLYGPLLRTLIALTEPRKSFGATSGVEPPTPTVIFSYKVRSLTREEPFWRAFGRWFEFDPVQVGRRRRTPQPDPPADPEPDNPAQGQEEDELVWTRYGSEMGSSSDPAFGGTTSIGDKDDELYVFVCWRHPSTFGALGSVHGSGSEGPPPGHDDVLFGDVTDEELLLGLGKAGGHSAGADRFEEILLANLEWD